MNFVHFKRDLRNLTKNTFVIHDEYSHLSTVISNPEDHTKEKINTCK